jgi:hypothetical protein
MSTPKPLRRKTTVAEHLADTDQFRGKVVIAAIDFHHTLLYVTDATPGQQPAKLVAGDPRGYYRKVSHDAGNPRGIYEDDSTEYWQAISDAVASAGAILVLGHGQGRANASHHWVAYVEKHRADVAARIVAEVRVDIEALTGEQVLRLAQQHLGTAPLRDAGDGRWGEPQDSESVSEGQRSSD